MIVVLTVHHHHVDHETHDGEAKHQAEDERVLPPDGEKETIGGSCSYSSIAQMMLKLSIRLLKVLGTNSNKHSEASDVSTGTYLMTV